MSSIDNVIRSMRTFIVDAIVLTDRYFIAENVVDWAAEQLLQGVDINVVTKVDGNTVPLRDHHIYVIAGEAQPYQYRLDAVHPRLADMLSAKGLGRVVEGSQLTMMDISLAARVDILERLDNTP